MNDAILIAGMVNKMAWLRTEKFFIRFGSRNCPYGRNLGDDFFIFLLGIIQDTKQNELIRKQFTNLLPFHRQTILPCWISCIYFTTF